jgi:beta-lactam-binding protein with PASTA domain
MSFRARLRRFARMTRMVTVRVLGGFVMATLFVVCAFAAMRLAIHGREVTVPNLANLSDADAASAARQLGLNLSVENRFYSSAVGANHVLSQSPAPGSRVRSGWQIRVTESLGSQQVPVPDVTGQDEHPATLMLRRLQLELGTVAHIPGPSPAGVVLAQSPPPNVAGLDGPRVAILVADEENSPASIGYVMPSIVGLTLASAQSRLAAAGLHIGFPSASEEPDASDASPLEPNSASDPAIAPVVAVPRSTSSVITSQSPLPGHRVTRADTIHVTLASPS